MVNAVFFDLDNTLYDTKLQVDSARRNAVKAMIGSGLDVEFADAFKRLNEVVSRHGSNFKNHYDELLKSYGMATEEKIIAAGIVAYHETKKAYLVPYPDTIRTLLRLKELGLKTGVVTDGVPVKQWEKLIMLGLGDFFDVVVVNSEGGRVKPDPTSLIEAAEKVGVDPSECMIVGDRLDRDILAGNRAGFTTVQLVKGHQSVPRDTQEEPDYMITELSGILEIIK
ncbi:MAG: TIGR02253 family HAD-type hydrolase [Candidatus Altiarchaeota archaeon]